MEFKSTLSKKQSYGQFYTTNYSYIFQDMDLTLFKDDAIFLEPFVGKGHLLEFIQNNFENKTIHCFDIDPKCSQGKVQDTLLTPPSYKDTIVITNPPYLSKNKSKDKKYFDLYNQNDLYKCFLETILRDPPNGGMIIIPLNFWCSIRDFDAKLRERFVKMFQVHRVNVFEEAVFDDTTYTICSILFTKSSSNRTSYLVPMFIYPSKKSIEIALSKENSWTIGGEIYCLPSSKYKVGRLVVGGTPNTKILLKALDDDSKNKICLKMSEEPYYGKISSRTYATLTIDPIISVEKQEEIVKRFNEFLEIHREKYHSLFLTNYRESKDISRKRISFDLVYQIVRYLLI